MQPGNWACVSAQRHCVEAQLAWRLLFQCATVVTGKPAFAIVVVVGGSARAASLL